MKNVEDILEASLEKVVNSIKEEQEQETETETETETFWHKIKNSSPPIQLGLSLGLISIVTGFYLVKK